MTLIYEIITLILAILIVLFSSITVYLGTRYLILTKFKNQFDWLVLIQTTVALAWVIIFGYIAEETIRSTSPAIIGSFGNMFIRPVILLSSVSASIWMAVRYKFEKSGGLDRWNLHKK